MVNLSTAEWIAIIGIIVAALFGLLQVLRNNAAKSGKINVSQSSGAFSKGKQEIKMDVKQNDK